MLQDLVEDPGELSADELHARYLEELRAVVEADGVGTVAAESGVDVDTLEALVAGESPEFTLQEAGSVLAAHEGRSGEVIANESRDALLMGMTTAVLDVEALSSEVERELDPREVQSKVEGRFPMTLREFALLHGAIQNRVP